MEAAYATTIDDLVALNLHVMRRSPSMRWRFVIMWIVPPVICCVFAALVADGDPIGAIWFAIGGAAYVIGYPILHAFHVRRTMRGLVNDLGSRGVVGRITLVLADDTITERTESVQTTVRWSDVKGFEIVNDCLYVYLTGMQALVIPRHGFERADDYETVRNLVVSKLDKTALTDSKP